MKRMFLLLFLVAAVAMLTGCGGENGDEGMLRPVIETGEERRPEIVLYGPLLLGDVSIDIDRAAGNFRVVGP
ncbi:MAG: hypothetical protein FWC93_01525 [Defluviitaleaceae bacterium]|nr:hypothetical protein [Defluviitaleaceae bacterium]